MFRLWLTAACAQGDHFVRPRVAALGGLSRAHDRALASSTWDSQSPGPLSFRTGKIQRKGQTNAVGGRLAAGVTRRFRDAKPAAYCTPLQIFCWGQLPPSLCNSHDIRKAAKVFCQSFLLCMSQVAQRYMVPMPRT